MDTLLVADISDTIYHTRGGQRPIDLVTALWGDCCDQNTTGSCEGTAERERFPGGSDQFGVGRL